MLPFCLEIEQPELPSYFPARERQNEEKENYLYEGPSVIDMGGEVNGWPFFVSQGDLPKDRSGSETIQQ